MKKWRRKEEEWQQATWWGPQIDGFVFFFLPFLKSKSDTGRNVHFSQNWPDIDGMAGTSRNWPKFDPRWNGWYYYIGLHVSTRYSDHSVQNGMKLITLVIFKANHS